MHPLRVWLAISLGIAVAVAWGFGAALRHANTDGRAAVVIGMATFVAFLLPWLGVFLWAVRRARDIDELTDRAQAAAERISIPGPPPRLHHAELDDLGRAIEELREMVARQRQEHDEHRAAMTEIVSFLGEGLMAVDSHGRIVFANDRFAETFGIGPDVVGRSAVEVVRRRPVVSALDAALRGQATTARISIGTDDQERRVEVRTVPVVSSEIAAVALFIDVTALERLQRVRKDFLDDFSHEVRTPLAALKSASETLEHGPLTPEHEQQLRSIIQRQITRIERLVNDLSELNRIETGELVLQKRPVRLHDLLRDLCDEFQGRAGAVRFSLYGEQTVVAAVDGLRVQQIVSNLLDNAWKHGGGSGEIRVEIARDGGEAVVRVSDQGRGLPPQELERVFNRFYRVDRSRSTGGTGLGLAIAKHLVALHGGTIRAFNNPGGGATFEVRLPLELK